MSKNEKDRYTDWLVNYDEAIRSGDLPPAPELDRSIEHIQATKAVECLAILEKVWPRQISIAGSKSATDAGRNAAETNPTGIDRAGPLLPDRIGKFLILDVLGEGGFGIVLRAFDTTLGREVALKIPKLNSALNIDQLTRFERESKLLAQLNHPHVVSVLEAGDIDGQSYIASQLCQGPSLADWLHGQPNTVSAFQAASIAISIAEGLEHAHSRNVLHRDLKPSNILCDGTRADGIPLIRIADFGLARMIDEQLEATRSGLVLGTSCYMSPEQARGQTDLEQQSDIYSFGVIIYEMLAGSVPHCGENQVDTLLKVHNVEPVPPRRFRADIPRDLETICLHCLEKNPGDRYANTTALKNDLRHFLLGEPISVRSTSLANRWIKRAKRNPATTALSVCTVLFFTMLTLGLPVAMLVLQHKNHVISGEAEKAANAERIASQRLWDSLSMQVAIAAESKEFGARFAALDLYRRAMSLLPEIGQQDTRPLQASIMDAVSTSDFILKQVTIPDHPGKSLLLQADPTGEFIVEVSESSSGYGLYCHRVGSTELGPPVAMLAQRPLQIAVSDGADRIAMIVEDEISSTIDIFWAEGAVPQANHTFKKLERIRFANCDLVKLSRDGQCVAAAAGNELRIFDAGSAKMLSSVELRENITCVAIDDLRRRLACGAGNRIEILDLQSGKIEATLQHEYPPAVTAVAWNRLGDRVLVGRQDFHAYLWQIDCVNARRLVLDKHQEWVTKVGFVGNRDEMITTGVSSAGLWEPVQGKNLRFAKRKVVSVFDNGLFFRDGKNLHRAILSDSPLKVVLDSREKSYEAYAIAASESEDWIAASGLKTLHLWRLPDYREELLIDFPAASKLAFSSRLRGTSPEHLLAVTEAGIYRVDLSESARGDSLLVVDRQEIFGETATLGGDGETAYWIDPDGSLMRWERGVQGEVCQITNILSPSERSAPNSLAIFVDPIRPRAAVVDRSRGRCEFVNLKSGRIFHSIDVEQGQITRIEFSPDAGRIAILDDETCRVVLFDGSGPLSAVVVADEHATCLKFGADGHTAFVGLDSGDLVWFDLSTASPIVRLHCHTKAASIELAQQASLLLTTGQNLKVVAWNLAKLRELVCLSQAGAQE